MGFPNLISLIRAHQMMAQASPDDGSDDTIISHRDKTQSEPLDKDATSSPAAESHVGDVKDNDVEEYGLDKPNSTPPKDRPDDEDDADEGPNATPSKDKPGDEGAESDDVGEPGSDDIHSTLSAIVKSASQEGPSVAAYRKMLTQMPQRGKPDIMSRIGAGLSGWGAGWFHPGTGFRVADEQVNAPYREAMGDYQNKLKDLAVGANLEQGGKNKLASLASTMTYRDLIAQNRKDALKLNQDRLDEARLSHQENEKIRQGNAETAKQAAIDKEKDRALTRAEIASRDAESKRMHDAQIADIGERTKGRQQQEEQRQSQQTDEDVLSRAKSLGFQVPTDDKTGRELYTPGTADDAASYLAWKDAHDKSPYGGIIEEKQDEKGKNIIGIKQDANVAPGVRSALGTWIYNRKKELRPHAYLSKIK